MDGRFAEDGEVLTEKLQKQCKETTTREGRPCSKRVGSRSTGEKETDNSRRKEELHTSQLFWCVVRMAKKADENVSRPEDSIVTEMINAFLKKDLWNSSVSKLALWVRKKR